MKKHRLNKFENKVSNCKGGSVCRINSFNIKENSWEVAYNLVKWETVLKLERDFALLSMRDALLLW
jgi:hypothetical protein